MVCAQRDRQKHQRRRVIDDYPLGNFARGGRETKQGYRPMTKKTKTEALAFALRLSITAETKERSKQALEIAEQLAAGMTAEEVEASKQMAAV